MKKSEYVGKLTKAAVLAAVYAVLTWFAGMLGLGYGAVQFRFSEALCILPVYTASAIPGLTLGCALANLTGTLGPVDIVVGSLATFLQTVCARKWRNIRIKNVPFLSLLTPVVFNALFIGAETAFLNGTAGFGTAFLSTALSVGASEALVCLLLGLPLTVIIEKNKTLHIILSDKEG